MIPRFPMTPETAKAIMEDNERRVRHARKRSAPKRLHENWRQHCATSRGPHSPALTGGIPTVLARMRSRCVRWLLPLRWGIGSRTKRINLHRLA